MKGVIVSVSIRRPWWKRLRRRRPDVVTGVTYGGVTMDRAVNPSGSSDFYYYILGTDIPTEDRA